MEQILVRTVAQSVEGHATALFQFEVVQGCFWGRSIRREIHGGTQNIVGNLRKMRLGLEDRVLLLVSKQRKWSVLSLGVAQEGAPVVISNPQYWCGESGRQVEQFDTAPFAVISDIDATELSQSLAGAPIGGSGIGCLSIMLDESKNVRGVLSNDLVLTDPELPKSPSAVEPAPSEPLPPVPTSGITGYPTGERIMHSGRLAGAKVQASHRGSIRPVTRTGRLLRSGASTTTCTALSARVDGSSSVLVESFGVEPAMLTMKKNRQTSLGLGRRVCDYCWVSQSGASLGLDGRCESRTLQQIIVSHYWEGKIPKYVADSG